jgi:hypothetical protein
MHDLVEGKCGEATNPRDCSRQGMSFRGALFILSEQIRRYISNAYAIGTRLAVKCLWEMLYAERVDLRPVVRLDLYGQI